MLKSKAGLTLVEVLLAISVILIGIVAVTKLFPFSLQVNKTAEQATVATHLAQAKIEELFYLDFDDMGIGQVESKTRLADDPASPFYNYFRQVDIEYVDHDLASSVSATGLKLATVTVFWTNANTRAESQVQLKILICQK